MLEEERLVVVLPDQLPVAWSEALIELRLWNIGPRFYIAEHLPQPFLSIGSFPYIGDEFLPPACATQLILAPAICPFVKGQRDTTWVRTGPRWNFPDARRPDIR